ncbi:GGDEF domain-containing protein [Luteimonas terrae]|uniref:diguanylate cyclase n=1 Tax=Luteimonas terrae TaxID=1530191 RepID=A0ABU1XUD1_9GAMM|nr:diguanylate cyclase [Luteimonas terrae]MDR7192374.1 diguanylate cyclase (GGDEF)-like protein [Luteimonas terrae]
MKRRRGWRAMAMAVAMGALMCMLAACGQPGTPAPVVTGAPALVSNDPHECVHAHGPGREVLQLPAPEGGWSGHPQAVVVLNALSGEVDIRHGQRDRCGTLADARTLDSRFRAGVGTVLVPRQGDTAPIEIEYDANPLPLWRPIVQLGEPTPVQRADIVRFAIRVASLAVVLTLVMSALLSFIATRERAFLTYAATVSVFAAWLALLSGMWAWPRPWLPIAGFAVEAMVGLAVALVGMTTLALVRQSWLRRRLPQVERGVRWAARALVVAGLSTPLLPPGVLAAMSVATELGFYLLALLFTGVAATAMIQRHGGGASLLAGVLPFLAVAALETFAPATLALWKVEAFMLSGGWLALTCSMVLTLRLGVLRRQRDEMTRLAQTDPLTGLPNRRAALTRLEHSIAAARADGAPLTVAFLDLDHFKRINDLYGHECGDRVLQHVANALRGAFRSADHVARMGGEEFLVILPGADVEHARLRVDTLRAMLLNTAVALDQPGMQVTLSAGVSALRDDDAGVDALLRRADAAMYAAKHAGRDRTALDDELPALAQ